MSRVTLRGVLTLRLLLIVWAVSALAPVGCVRRRLTIRSDPPGAMAYVDQTPIGPTPVSASFRYYGTRSIELVKDGYETTKVKEKIRPPWYQLPVLDFVFENLWPGELRHEPEVRFQLTPQKIVSGEELQRRAQDLRDNARLGYAAPVPGTGQQPFSTNARQPPSAPAPPPANLQLTPYTPPAPNGFHPPPSP